MRHMRRILLLMKTPDSKGTDKPKAINPECKPTLGWIRHLPEVGSVTRRIFADQEMSLLKAREDHVRAILEVDRELERLRGSAVKDIRQGHAWTEEEITGAIIAWHESNKT
jgi:hypothetical protein